MFLSLLCNPRTTKIEGGRVRMKERFLYMTYRESVELLATGYSDGVWPRSLETPGAKGWQQEAGYS